MFARRGRTVTALAGVDLEIGAGEFVSLLGPSGCGKSTLLRIIGGLQRPVRGDVVVAGATAEAARAGKQYGLVPQSPALVPWKTVAENVRFLSGLRRRRRAADRPLGDAEIAGLLDAVGLTGFEKSFPHELSGGMQQCVRGRAFALGAPILLMDEPFAALMSRPRNFCNSETS